MNEPQRQKFFKNLLSLSFLLINQDVVYDKI